MQQNHNGTRNNDERRLLKKNIPLILLQGLRVRGSWRPNTTAIYWPPLLWPSALGLSRSPGLLNRRPGDPFCWLSLLHLITNWFGPQTPSGVPRAPSARWWLSLPHLFSNSSALKLVCSPTHWLPVCTELYNSSIAHSIFGMACLIVIKRK